MEVIKDIRRFKKKKKKLKIDRWVLFHPYANFNCQYLKIDLCDLFQVCWSVSTFASLPTYRMRCNITLGIFIISVVITDFHWGPRGKSSQGGSIIKVVMQKGMCRGVTRCAVKSGWGWKFPPSPQNFHFGTPKQISVVSKSRKKRVFCSFSYLSPFKM